MQKFLWYNNGFTPSLGINRTTDAERPELVSALAELIRVQQGLLLSR